MTKFSSHRFVAAKLTATLALAGAALAACAPTTMAPQQVQAANPTVTYKYRGDQELVNANANATTFCSRYAGAPRTVNLSNDSEGNRVVVFECVPTPPAPATVVAAAPSPPIVVAQSNPLVYSYTTDQQLIDASRNAQAYCLSQGSAQATSTIVTNSNGTRTITFQCGPR